LFVLAETGVFRQEALPPLNQVQQEEINRKVSQWANKYQLEWELQGQLQSSKEERWRLLAEKAEAGGTPVQGGLQSPSFQHVMEA
jgi:hypothetical protein